MEKIFKLITKNGDVILGEYIDNIGWFDINGYQINKDYIVYYY